MINFDKQSFVNYEKWEEMWCEPFLKFSFQMSFDWLIQTKT